MESLRLVMVKITRNTEEQKTIAPDERLIEFLNPILGKFCKKFYKQHIKHVKKLTHSNKQKEKDANIPNKENKSDKEQSKYNIESRTRKGDNFMPDANNQDPPRQNLPPPSHIFCIQPDSIT